MAIEFSPSNKMMTEAPDKKEFHFSGDGIWRNKAIIAETREEAEKIWHSVKLLINPEKPTVIVDTTVAIEQTATEPAAQQSTPTPAPKIEGGVVE
jgi:hypothetical protein